MSVNKSYLFGLFGSNSDPLIHFRFRQDPHVGSFFHADFGAWVHVVVMKRKLIASSNPACGSILFVT